MNKVGIAFLDRVLPFMIAEVSCNHVGRRDILDATINAAFSAGADAVKLQSSEPECLTRNYDSPEFIVQQPGSPWHGVHLYNLYERTCTPLGWPPEEINSAKNLNRVVFSTPFSPRMVDFLESSASPALYKVSSIDWNYIELIRRCLDTGKPVLVSLVQPSAQLPVLIDNRCDDVIPLYCVSKYPAAPADFNMGELQFLSRHYPGRFGFSDHSVTPALAALAVSHGAMVIERHFKLNSLIDSDDAHFSSTPDEFAALVSVCREVAVARQSQSNTTTIPIGRSVYIDRSVEAGQRITREDLCVIRPGGGMSPTQIPFILERKAIRRLPKGTRLQEKDLV